MLFMYIGEFFSLFFAEPKYKWYFESTPDVIIKLTHFYLRLTFNFFKKCPCIPRFLENISVQFS